MSDGPSPRATPSNHQALEDKAEQMSPDSPPRSTARSILIVGTCTLGMIMNNANTTAASVALPRIGSSLHIDQAQLQWIVSAYSLSSACLLLFFGRLADLYGRKRAFLLGTLCTSVFGLGCGFAQDEVTIAVLRAFQGLGPAASIPASLGILAAAFPPSRARSIAFATFSTGSPLGAAIGMIIGGVLTQSTEKTWRSSFWFTSGMGFATFLSGLLSIDADRFEEAGEKDRRVDWIGAVLITVGLVLVVFVLSDGETAPQGWKTPYIIILLIVGVFFIVAFYLWQRYLEQTRASLPSGPNARVDSKWLPPPLMNASLWTRAHGRLAAMMLVAFFTWCCFIAWQFWAQLYYQDFAHLSPVRTMLRMLPMFISGVAANALAGMLVGRVDVVYMSLVGTVCTGVSALIFALIDVHASYWAFGFPSAVLSVVGVDFVFTAGTLFMAKFALPHEQSLAGALFQTMTQIGTAFGLAISTIVFDSVNKDRLGKSDDARAAQLSGYRSAQWTDFGFSMFAAVLAVVFLRGVGIVGHQEEGESESGRQTASETVSGEDVVEEAESTSESGRQTASETVSGGDVVAQEIQEGEKARVVDVL